MNLEIVESILYQQPRYLLKLILRAGYHPVLKSGVSTLGVPLALAFKKE